MWWCILFSKGAHWKGPGSIERPCREQLVCKHWYRHQFAEEKLQPTSRLEPRVSGDQVHERYPKANPVVISGNSYQWPNANPFEDHPRDILDRHLCLESNKTLNSTLKTQNIQRDLEIRSEILIVQSDMTGKMAAWPHFGLEVCTGFPDQEKNTMMKSSSENGNLPVKSINPLAFWPSSRTLSHVKN